MVDILVSFRGEFEEEGEKEEEEELYLDDVSIVNYFVFVGNLERLKY